MSTHNIGFYEDLTKLSFNYHQICTLSLFLVYVNVLNIYCGYLVIMLLISP